MLQCLYCSKTVFLSSITANLKASLAAALFIPFTGFSGLSLTINSLMILLFHSTNWLPHWEYGIYFHRCAHWELRLAFSAIWQNRSSHIDQHNQAPAQSCTIRHESATERKFISMTLSHFSPVNVFGSLDLLWIY